MVCCEVNEYVVCYEVNEYVWCEVHYVNHHTDTIVGTVECGFCCEFHISGLKKSNF